MDTTFQKTQSGLFEISFEFARIKNNDVRAMIENFIFICSRQDYIRLDLCHVMHY